MRSHAREVSFIRKSPGYVILAADRVASWILPNHKPELSPEMKRRLQEYYAQDMSRLSALIDKELAL